MRRNDLFCMAVMAAFALSMAAAPAAAKGGSNNAKVKPTVGVATAKPGATTKARGSSSMAGAKTKAQTPKVKSTSATKAKASGSPKAGSKPASGKSETKANKPADKRPSETKPPDANPTATGPTVPLNKAQQLLMKNDNLRLKMQTRLGGLIDPIDAAAGFRNLGQFVAAVNVSFNHPGIEFKALRALMTGPQPMSLGQALQQLRGLDPATATSTANTAFAQANADITATSPTAAKKTKTRKS
jgi:hypothetical protein